MNFLPFQRWQMVFVHSLSTFLTMSNLSAREETTRNPGIISHLCLCFYREHLGSLFICSRHFLNIISPSDSPTFQHSWCSGWIRHSIFSFSGFRKKLKVICWSSSQAAGGIICLGATQRSPQEVISRTCAPSGWVSGAWMATVTASPPALPCFPLISFSRRASSLRAAAEHI